MPPALKEQHQSLSRFDYLASSIAGQHVSVIPAKAPASAVFSDGQNILVPQDWVGREDIWLAVIAQALLIFGGAFSRREMRRIASHPAAAQRYAFLELRRIVRQSSVRLPTSFSDHPALCEALPLEAETHSSAASLALATSAPEAWLNPPWFSGTIEPHSVLRRRRQFTAPRWLSSGFGWWKKYSSPKPASTKKAKPAATGKNKQFELALNPAVRLLLQLLHWLATLRLPGLYLSEGTPQFRYREWNEYRGRYIADHVQLNEVEPLPSGDEGELLVLRQPSRQMLRQLMSLGLVYEPRRRELEGDDLTTDRLIDRAIDLQVGVTPPALDIYRASRKLGRDFGVIVMIDVSSSTADDDGKGGRIFDQQLTAAWQLAKTFARLGDHVGVYAYKSGWRRNSVDVICLKAWEERWSEQLSTRMGRLNPGGGTRTGGAVRHASFLLQTRYRCTNRLLVLITDGLPGDAGYGGAYAMADTRKALLEARQSGIACVSLCINTQVKQAAMEDVFGESSLLLVDGSEKISRRMRGTCNAAFATMARAQCREALR